MVMREFDHRQLDVYRVSLEYVAYADQLANSFPPGRGGLVDQLRRASTSICLNIAEGAAGDEMLLRIVEMLTKMIKRTAPRE